MGQNHSIYRLRTRCIRCACASRRPEGSSLLIAIMIMGILMTLALGVSNILIGTLRENRLFVEKTKAWYGAESGVEQALFQISEHGPGFDTEKKLADAGLKYDYKVQATSSKIPKKEDFEIHYDKNDPASYSDLTHNESVTIPLFKTLANGDIEAVHHFKVDFYLSPELQKRGGSIYQGLDILRWKVFGIANGGKNKGKMEVINEFLPMEETQNAANNPTCLGTETGCWNGAKFFQWNYSTEEYDEIYPFAISQFLEEHTQNFLVLTNSINTDLIQDLSLHSYEIAAISNVRYRVSQLDDGASRLTLPHIRISSDGFSGDTKQSLNVNVKRESFLPVFNYSLYRTIEGE